MSGLQGACVSYHSSIWSATVLYQHQGATAPSNTPGHEPCTPASRRNGRGQGPPPHQDPDRRLPLSSLRPCQTLTNAISGTAIFLKGPECCCCCRCCHSRTLLQREDLNGGITWLPTPHATCLERGDCCCEAQQLLPPLPVSPCCSQPTPALLCSPCHEW